MHIFFSGIGGAGIGPLALIAKQAGYRVSGSDKQHSTYISYLEAHGISSISIGQHWDSIKTLHECEPIDWLVYSSAIPREQPDHPELAFARANHIKTSKRDEFLAHLLSEKSQSMIAVAGTHGKTTTTAMLVWLFKQLELPVSYSLGAKVSFGDMGEFNPSAEYFIYEADEYDRNFLQFHPKLSLIAGIDYDHPDIYPTREEYYAAFRQFIEQSEFVLAWESDMHRIGAQKDSHLQVLPTLSDLGDSKLVGRVNRQNAFLVANAAFKLGVCSLREAYEIMNHFPGVSRRFEKVVENLYTDYAHTPEKIRGALQIAQEKAGENVVVVYEGLHNTRQHFIRDELKTLFAGCKKLYVVPSYLAREDESLELLTPEKICAIAEQPTERIPSALDDTLKTAITEHLRAGDTVLCLSAGGGGSLDEWLRKKFIA